jgi:alcohol dehydrogenase
MKETYKAMQVTSPGVLELVERKTPMPKAGEVLIKVEACGICGADASDIENPNITAGSPRIPGHEVVGCIAVLGEDVAPTWKLGQRVGVGRLGGHCSYCVQCRRGVFQLCENQQFVGATCDGGYAEMIVVRATGLVSIPDELSSEEAAPILCAGLATFNALKKSGAQAGDTAAILGIGGLGHMALQYARRMGFRVIAIGRGAEIAPDAIALGAHRYIDTNQEDAAAILAQSGGAEAIISTIAQPAVVSQLMAGLSPQGKLVLLGASKDPLTVSTGHMVVGEHSILGSLTGSPYESEKALNFSVLTGARPMIEVLPLEKAGAAYQKMKSGEAKFRMVVSMSES